MPACKLLLVADGGHVVFRPRFPQEPGSNKIVGGHWPMLPGVSSISFGDHPPVKLKRLCERLTRTHTRKSRSATNISFDVNCPELSPLGFPDPRHPTVAIACTMLFSRTGGLFWVFQSQPFVHSNSPTRFPKYIGGFSQKAGSQNNGHSLVPQLGVLLGQESGQPEQRADREQRHEGLGGRGDFSGASH